MRKKSPDAIAALLEPKVDSLSLGWAVMSSSGWERPVLLGRGWFGVAFADPSHALAGHSIAVFKTRRECRAAAAGINSRTTLRDARAVRVRVHVAVVLRGTRGRK